MDRRKWISITTGAALGTWLGREGLDTHSPGRSSSGSSPDESNVSDATFGRPPAFSITPVVGDGKWIWTRPPEGQTGYLEPRRYDVEIGIDILGRGPANSIMATTPAPLEMPEQKIIAVNVRTRGCVAKLRQVDDRAGQLVLAAPSIAPGQTVSARVEMRMELTKQYQGYRPEAFPAEQDVARSMGKYLGDSPGIQTRDGRLRELAEQLARGSDHPWDRARQFHQWVWSNIKTRVGDFTSVKHALRDRVGDCEERAAVFVALCRASGIPARLVWVPNHNWTEFHLTDNDGRGHWIPCHTSAYKWFGWTGAHELVLQKGDRIKVPEKKSAKRLLEDWMRWVGKRPAARFTASLKPIADGGEDPGPGARSKDAKGEWLVVGGHPLDHYMRK